MKNKFQAIIQRAADRGKQRIQNTRPQTFVLCCTAVLLLVLLLIGVMVYESYWLYQKSRFLSAEDVGITDMLAEEQLTGYIVFSSLCKPEVTKERAGRLILLELADATFQRCSPSEARRNQRIKYQLNLKSASHDYNMVLSYSTIMIEIDGEKRYYLCNRCSDAIKQMDYWESVFFLNYHNLPHIDE